HVDTPGLREDAELQNFSLEAGEEDQPVVSARIKNTSSLLYDAAGEVTVRDQDRRLIERVPVRTESAAQGGGDETTIYPGSEVVFQGDVTEPLPAGDYDLQFFLRYGDGRQIIERKSVEVGDEFVDPEKMQYLEVSPEVVSDELRPGGALTQALEVRNRVGDPVMVKVGAREIAPDYKRSLRENLEMELRGGNSFQLEGRRSHRSVLIVRSSRDIEPGGYYDKLVVGAFDPETEEKLYEQEVDLDVLVGEDYEYGGEVQGLTAERMEDEVLLSATVVNTGDAHFAPRARVYLRREGEIQNTLILEMAEEGDRILPEKSGVVSTYAEGIEGGEYTAEVTLQHEGEEISQAEFPVEIEPRPEEDEGSEEEEEKEA
ncbi:MAG: hypothetical protein ACLFTO_06215, partial [Candidatus Acetothermia bacterium]